MAFRMSSLTRTKSGAWFSRKGIPKDVRDEYAALHGSRWEELFHRPASLPLLKAKVGHSEWEAGIDSRIAALRAKQRGEGRDLTQREAQALAGEWYRWYIDPHEENPGEPGHWAELREIFIDLITDATPWWDYDDPEFQHRDRAKEPEVREEVHPRLADEAKTAQFLASKGEVLTPTAMELFLDAVVQEFLEVTNLLRRRANGDYSAEKWSIFRPSRCSSNIVKTTRHRLTVDGLGCTAVT